MVTAVGFNAVASLAALRAGISGVRRLPWADPESGEPLRGAKIDMLQWSEEVRTLADMVASAIEECMEGIDPSDRRAIPVLIGVAARSRSGRHSDLDQKLLDAVAVRVGWSLHPASALFPGDQTGCVDALIAASRLLTAGKVRQVAVAGVDSYLRSLTIDAYADRMRLMTPSNSNGFFPGEAAAAILLVAADRASGDNLLIAGVGRTSETAVIESTQPLQAKGLTNAVRWALEDARLTMDDIAYRLTDLSGEHYKFKEAAFVALRLDRADRASELELWHPIEYLGEIGAAVVPCLLAWAMHASRHGYAPGPWSLCHVGNDDGERAALVLCARTDLDPDER
jgi:3-oxoacyl-[acyl-carrier-protein] synthase-1